MSAFREAAEVCPVGHPDRPDILHHLGAMLATRYTGTGNPADVEEAIALFDEAIEAAPADHPDQATYLSSLGNALRSRNEQDGQPADLEEAVDVGREAVAAAPAAHPGRPMFLSNLACALQARYGQTGRPADLDEAICIGREAVEAGPADLHIPLSNLGAALQARFKRTGQPADLDEAVAVGRMAVSVTPAGHPNRPMYLSNHTAVLQDRFEVTGERMDLDEAVAQAGKAVAATPALHPNRPGYLANLAKALRLRFERTGLMTDLDEAVTQIEEAVAAIPTGHPLRPMLLSDLAYALSGWFEHTGNPADLDEAVSVGRAAIAAAATDLPNPAFLTNLGKALHTRYELTGQPADLHEGVARLQEAVGASPVGHVDRPAYLSNLGAALQTRHELTGQQADLDAAIERHYEAVSASPAGNPYRPARLSNLAATLMAHYELTGQPADLDVAVVRLREAVSATPTSHPNRPIYLLNLATATVIRHALTGQPADLSDAVARLEEAVAATPVDHPNRSAFLANLGHALQARFELTGEPADMQEAITVFREGAEVPTAPPERRLHAARAWGGAAIGDGDVHSAMQAYTTAIELLALVVWHGLDHSTREHHLREWAGLSSEAAAAAIGAGAPARAVELLEAGRSVLWTQALHLRHDLAALRDRAPDLADVLETSRTVLADPPTPADDGVDPGEVDRARATDQDMLERRRQAARDWDAAVEEIRRLEGFEHFLRPVPFEDLRATAAAGPVVIVNISTHGSHALVLTPATASRSDSAMQVVELTDAPVDTVVEKASALLDAQERAGDPDMDWQTSERDRHAVFDVLAWTWQAITEPVLTLLGCTRTPGGHPEGWPRVWWCPTGPALLLPLHAAGMHPRTDTQYAVAGERDAVADTVAGRVISSYTPTLTALIRARTRLAPVRVRQLAVGVPDPPDYAPTAGPLPAVPDELRVVGDHLTEPEHATHLAGPAATRLAVMQALSGYSWLHLSCHGVQHETDANLSAFLLHDQPLTLADLTTLNLSEADLAYLAACQTATGDLDLIDESLHLAAGLQLVGYRHVLASLWNISDNAAPAMAEIIYAHLTHTDPTGQPDSARAPHALHDAVTQLRQVAPGDPLLWAPYIHLGP